MYTAWRLPFPFATSTSRIGSGPPETRRTGLLSRKSAAAPEERADELTLSGALDPARVPVQGVCGGPRRRKR